MAFRRRSHEDEVRRELQAHVELEAEELRARGLPAGAADREARRLVGNPTLVTERVREQSRWMWADRFGQDLRFACRIFRRSPAFTAAAILSIALGVGANAAIFSVINAVLLRPLPVDQPDRLVVVDNPRIGNFSYPHYRELRDQASSLSELVAASSTRTVTVESAGEAVQATAKMVSGNYFAGLGVPPATGRILTAADELEPVAMLSYGYWQRRFGGALVVGRSIAVNGYAMTVVGIAPRSFQSESPGDAPDVWTSMALQPQASREERGFTWLYLMGRLKAGVTLEQARVDLAALSAELRRQSGGDSTLQVVTVEAGATGGTSLRGSVMDPLMVLMISAGLVLLIACTNLAGLLLARSDARRHEVAMRLAIGATRPRIVRQLLTENLLLATAGGVLALPFAVWGSHAVIGLAGTLSNGRPIALDLTPDWRVLAFTAVVALVATVIFGLAPAVRSVRTGVVSGAALVGSRVVGRDRRWSARDVFLVLQVALSLVLVAGSALFVRTLVNLQSQDLGVKPDGVLMVTLVRERGYRPDLGVVLPRLLERLRAVVGVQSASAVTSGTLPGSTSGVTGLDVPGFTPRDADDQRARADWITPGYFETAGIPLVAGRDFSMADRAGAARVAILNQTAARQYFDREPAVGRAFTFNKNSYEIVGVAADAKYADLRAGAPRLIYFAVLQGGGINSLEVRTASPDPAAVAEAVRHAIHEVDPRLSAGPMQTLRDRVDQKMNGERLIALLAGFFGGLTLILASVGVYGSLAFSAARRTQEIGVRLALGATRVSVVAMVLRPIVWFLGIGLLLGAGGVVAVGSLVKSLLFGLAPTDLGSLTVAVVFIVLTAFGAGIVPAVRASRLDPARVLRE